STPPACPSACTPTRRHTASTPTCSATSTAGSWSMSPPTSDPVFLPSPRFGGEGPGVRGRDERKRGRSRVPFFVKHPGPESNGGAGLGTKGQVAVPSSAAAAPGRAGAGGGGRRPAGSARAAPPTSLCCSSPCAEAPSLSLTWGPFTGGIGQQPFRLVQQ